MGIPRRETLDLGNLKPPNQKLRLEQLLNALIVVTKADMNSSR